MTADIRMETPNALIESVYERAQEIPDLPDTEQKADWWHDIIREVLNRTGTKRTHEERNKAFLVFIFNDQTAVTEHRVEAIAFYLLDAVTYTTDVACSWDETDVQEARSSLSDQGFFLWSDAMESLRSAS